MNGLQKIHCNRRFVLPLLRDNDSWAKMLEDAQGECNAIREAHAGCEGLIEALRKQNQELQDQLQSLMRENMTKQQRLCAPMQGEMRKMQGQDAAGVGLLLMKASAAQQEVVKVVKITPGGAAAQDARIRVGDIIVAIDGASLVGLSMDEICSRIRGPEGQPISLSVERKEDGSLLSMEVCLHRQVVPTEHRTVTLAAAAPPERGYPGEIQPKAHGKESNETADAGQLNLVDALKENLFFSAINEAFQSINRPRDQNDDVIMM
mmetsp:Transcript_23258/g.75640  ORF Transcript_23258/g.75640 Transcript_23258/m.75640 type:complete len:263 (-) Transcript_23258:822-1610(-)